MNEMPQLVLSQSDIHQPWTVIFLDKKNDELSDKEK